MCHDSDAKIPPAADPKSGVGIDLDKLKDSIKKFLPRQGSPKFTMVALRHALTGASVGLIRFVELELIYLSDWPPADGSHVLLGLGSCSRQNESSPCIDAMRAVLMDTFEETKLAHVNLTS